MAGEDNGAARPGEVAGRSETEPGVVAATMAVRDCLIMVLGAFPNPIWRSDDHARRDYFNASWLAFTGRSMEQETGDGWTEGIHPEERECCLKVYAEAFEARRPFEIEYRLRHHDGEYRWILEFGTPIYDPVEGFAGYVGSCYDIHDRKEHAQQQAYVAMHDYLTGLPNRRSLEETLGRVVAHSRRGVHSSLVFLDVDDFERVNDWFGHVAGDQVLLAVSRLLRAQLRTEDLLARVGGYQFAAVLQGTGSDEARLVAGRMRRAVREQPFDVDGVSFDLSLSVGMVAIDGKLPAGELLAEAAAVCNSRKSGSIA